MMLVYSSGRCDPALAAFNREWIRQEGNGLKPPTMITSRDFGSARTLHMSETCPSRCHPYYYLVMSNAVMSPKKALDAFLRQVEECPFDTTG